MRNNVKYCTSILSVFERAGIFTKLIFSVSTCLPPLLTHFLLFLRQRIPKREAKESKFLFKDKVNLVCLCIWLCRKRWQRWYQTLRLNINWFSIKWAHFFVLYRFSTVFKVYCLNIHGNYEFILNQSCNNSSHNCNPRAFKNFEASECVARAGSIIMFSKISK